MHRLFFLFALSTWIRDIQLNSSVLLLLILHLFCFFHRCTTWVFSSHAWFNFSDVVSLSWPSRKKGTGADHGQHPETNHRATSSQYRVGETNPARYSWLPRQAWLPFQRLPQTETASVDTSDTSSLRAPNEKFKWIWLNSELLLSYFDVTFE